MKILNDITRLLGKPFPLEENQPIYFRDMAILSALVSLFLFVFQPFGIADVDSHKFWYCLGFGAMTFLGIVVYVFTIDHLLQRLNKKGNWTFGKWILNTLGKLFFISLANFLFAQLMLFDKLDWSLFPFMVYGTLMIGIFPLVIIGGFSLLKQEKKYQMIAAEINQSKFIPYSKVVHGLSVFDIPTTKIRYIEAFQNYIKIGFINAEGHFKIQTERETLKRILSKTEGSTIIKCHRSYLVNKESITSVTGNAQGLLLTLSDCDKTIPVSRSFVPVFRNS